ncbi:unnamed protein product [Caenorhabditis bovis]|uniref:Kinesin motor domain-containing protein n=1 Tax=Caenorhabditis bovis TaxID=2654633 RepID=A0A8S1F620_9PELO|nr:unnamed protein product [Caenorhabditis bovis]
MTDRRKSSKQESVKVIVRCRPLSTTEVENGHKKIVHMQCERGQIELENPKEPNEPSKNFTFDAIYDENSTQTDLYEETFRDLVDSVLNGYNATIFAYGQTGTGKTYTMEGKSEIAEQRGVIYKCIDHIFEHIANSRNQQYLVRASYLEIYQEELRDLLSRDVGKKLEIKERPDGGVYVKDLLAFVTNSAESIQKVMATGNAQRSVGRTNMNEHSSRSHAIFMITVECSQTGLDGENHITVGRLNLVDLAGSERQAKTGATGERFKEATKINLSLSALGNVISALVDAKSSHIPYRDSKLTRLLQDSLGGNSKTVMVACIGPASYNFEETLGTLRYANRAKNIKNQPKINEDPKDALLREFQEEIQRLREKLERKKIRSRGGGSSTSQSYYEEEKQKLENDMDRIMRNDGLVRQEKESLIKELEEKSRLLEKERLEQAKVAEQIANIQSRLIMGEAGEQLASRTREQQQQLERKRKELAEQKKREREMAEQLERQEEDTVDLKQTFSDLRAEVEAKTKKLKKLIFKLRQARNEIRDAAEAFSDERQDLDQSIAEINKELKLKLLIVENFIPREVTERIKERAEWNEEDSSWSVNAYRPTSSASSSTSTTVPIIVGELDGGVLTRSSGADSGVSVGSPSSTSAQILDKRPTATLGVRRPMSLCEKMYVERARQQLSTQRRPPISGSSAFVEPILPEETIRFCGENIVVFSSLERFVPDVTDSDPMDIPAAFKKRVCPQRHRKTRQWKFGDEIRKSKQRNEMRTKEINWEHEYLKATTIPAQDDSSESEGICADLASSHEEDQLRKRTPSPSSRGSMSSSMHHSMTASMATPTRKPTRIPGIMSRSLSSSTPRRHDLLKPLEAYGSGEQLCDGYRDRTTESRLLLDRSREKKRLRASSFDPRCMMALQSSGSLVTSSMMVSSYSPTHSRLLPKRPKWVRHLSCQPLDAAAMVVPPKRWFKLQLNSNEDPIFRIRTVECSRCRDSKRLRRLQRRNRKRKFTKYGKDRHQRCLQKLLPKESGLAAKLGPFDCAVLFAILAVVFRFLMFISESF